MTVLKDSNSYFHTGTSVDANVGTVFNLVRGKDGSREEYPWHHEVGMDAGIYVLVFR